MNDAGVIKSMRNNVTLKLFVIGSLVLILTIPMGMVQSLISERENRKAYVVTEVSSRWGEAQTIAGPIVTIPYKHYFYTNVKDSARYEIRYAHFLPKTLEITGELKPEIRYRGIYQVVLYNGKFDVNGSFDRFDFARFNIAAQDILWDRAFLALGISDLKGLKENIIVNLNNSKLSLDPSVENKDVLSSGVSARLPDKLIRQRDTAPLSFAFKLDLNGSDRIYFVPVGEITEVNLSSDWKSPSFDGAFLPVERHVTETGFQARWKVLHLNRNFPQAWLGANAKISDAAFGARLFVAADIYQQSTRSAKYALLFIVLTFSAFFFSEVIQRKRLHFIQYLFIGFALLIFYSLLIALSEQMRFALAYAISSSAITFLIALYTHWILNTRKMTALIGTLVALLYGYLYILLQLEDYSLLMGTLGLLVTLAAGMYITRKMDWYASGGGVPGGMKEN